LTAGITWWNFYFQIFPDTIKAPQIIEFLTHLLRHLQRPLLVVWDGLPGHQSAAVRAFVQAQQGRLTLEFLPGYAPELNPVEYIWAHLKHHELPNLCPPRAPASQRRRTRRLATDAPSAPAGHRVLPASRPLRVDVTTLCKAQ
jgi:transposase